MEQKTQYQNLNSFDQKNLKKNTDENFDIKRVFEALLRRKRIVLFTTTIFFTLGLVNTINQRIKNPIFRGSFSLLISDPITNNLQASNNNFSTAITSQQTVDISTLIEVLKSPSVLSDIASKYNLSSKSLGDSININPVFNKSGKAKGILEISLESNNPRKLKNLLNDVSESFINASILERQKKLVDGLSFLSTQEPVLKNNVKSIQNEILNLRKKYNFITPEDNSIRIKNTINTYKVDIDKINIDIKKLKEVKAEIKKGNLSVISSNEFFENNSEISVIDTEQSKLEEIKELRSKLSKAKLTFKKDSNLVLSLEKKLDLLMPEIINYQMDVLNNKTNSLIRRKNNYLTVINNLQDEFKFQSELQNEYDEIELKLQYAISSLDSLTKAKEDFQLSLAQSNVPWKIIKTANVGSRPIKPSIPYNIATSLMAGLIFGIIAGLIRERFDYVYHDSEEIKNMIKLPILATVPYYSALEGLRKSKKNVLKILEDPLSKSKKDLDRNIKSKKYEKFFIQEAFRNLFTNIKFIDDKKKSHSLLLTSSVPSEGKSLINVLLAKTISELGFKVLLIDCDLRKPQIHTRVGMNNLKGFSDLFFDNKYLWTDAVKTVKNYKNWDIITAGSKLIDPIRILSSDKLSEIMQDIVNSEKYDFVLYDTPPALTFSDPILISKYIDGAILTVSLNQVSKDLPIKVVDQLSSSGIDIFGLVVNQNKYNPNFRQSNSYYYNNYYNSYYADSEIDAPIEEKELDLKSVNKIKLYRQKIVSVSKRIIKWIDL